MKVVVEPLAADSHWLYGYAISGIGGISADSQVRLGPLAKVNFLVGRNNHGKSTMLRAAQHWTSARGPAPGTGASATLVPVARQDLSRMLRQCGVTDPQEVERRFSSFVSVGEDQLGIWAERSSASNSNGVFDANSLTRTVKEGLRISNYSVAYPGTIHPHVATRCVLIPAFRQMREASPNTKAPDLASGEGLIAELSTWERPKAPGTAGYLAAKERWSRLREFVRDVLEDHEAELEIADATDLHVRLAQAGAMLHIDSLGDGIKQVLMIAAACIYFDDHLVLLEEPEIHLHAGLQRKLMRFLSTRTASQYLVATHSAHVLDLPGAKIFHVTHDGESTRVTSAVRASNVQQVCLDLGYMASDLLQSNFTIWVEGPSDRVYWGRWLQLIDPELAEGVHFTIMSYGGYLIDSVHLRDEPDPATEDLVQLLKLGRQCVVIADSDKTTDVDGLRPTLVRLQHEAEQPGAGGLIVCDWVRTVENLVPRELFRTTVIGRHPTAGKALKSSSSFGPFDAPFDRMRKGTYSKVAIAKDVAAKLQVADMDGQLQDVVTALASSIRSANGLRALH